MSEVREVDAVLVRTTMEKALIALGIIVGFPLVLASAPLLFAGFVATNFDGYQVVPWVADWMAAAALALVVGACLVGGVIAYALDTEAEFEREKQEREALKREALKRTTSANTKTTLWPQRPRRRAYAARGWNQ